MPDTATPTKADSIREIRRKMRTMSPDGKAYAYGAIDALGGKKADFERRQATQGDDLARAYLAGWCRVHGF
jgi:hypothetical protein